MANPEQITVGVSSRDMQLLEQLRADFAGHAGIVSVSAPAVYEYRDMNASLPHITVRITGSAECPPRKPVDVVYEVVRQRLRQDPDCKHRKVLIYTSDHTPAFIAECRTGKACDLEARKSGS